MTFSWLTFNPFFSFNLEIAFLHKNNIFSSGSMFSLLLRQENSTDPPLTNNSIQNWNYTHLINGVKSVKRQKILKLKTSFTSTNLSKGFIQGLSLDSAGNDGIKNTSFSLKSTLRDQISTNYLVLPNVQHWLSEVLCVAYVFQFLFVDLKLRPNFGYASARFLSLFLMGYDVFWEVVFSASIVNVLVIQFVEALLMIIYWGISFKKEMFKADLKELCKKKGALVFVSMVLLTLLTIDMSYYPMVVFVPLLMAWLDRLQSRGCQPLRLLLILEMAKFTFILLGCYFPCSVIPDRYSLLMVFNYQNLSLFCFLGYILLPGLFFIQMVFSRKSIKRLRLELIRQEIHGNRSKNNPICIQKGQGDVIMKEFNLLSKKYPDPYFGKKVAFYCPTSFLGVIEVELTKARVPYKGLSLTPTGYLNFFRYKTRKDPLASSMPQHCEELGYRASIKFKVSNESRDHQKVNIIPVETPESTSNQKFIAIVLDNSGKPILEQKLFKN